VLKWPRDHFKKPGATLRRSEYVRAEFEKFLGSEVGRSAHPETIRVLESMQWNGEFLPTETLYKAVTFAMEGHYTPAQIAAALQLEAEDAVRGAKPDEGRAAKSARRKRSS
jgi:hypothetical protein